MKILQRNNNEMPDSYCLKIYFLDGKTQSFELVGHTLNSTSQMVELRTKEDLIHWIPVLSVKNFEFDLNFSKIVRLNQERIEREKKK